MSSPVPAAPPQVDVVREVLERWAVEASPLPPGQEELRRRYLDQLDVPGALRKGGAPDHLTASALVLDPSGTRALLVLHRRGGFWVQPGGHLEPSDTGTREAALREVCEETGVPVSAVALSDLPADLDHHQLGAAFGRCRSHLDVAHLAVVDPAVPLHVSAESDDVAWWPLDALPGTPDGEPESELLPAVVPDLPPRLHRAVSLLPRAR
ncbi:NUDIX hydrolase [Pseudokineococcus sp. 1T1Z-3]|uniref:NUDIX hydrolase n=1 Tax=Pseudokineococcus sp. 1T1Z-3 TaxID=3132745 RepID=UPI0030ACFF76